MIKSVRHIDDVESCPNCGEVGERYISAQQSFSGADDWDTAHYSPAFGKVMRSNRHARQEAKARGWEEMGTECPEKTLNQFEKDREKKIQSRYDDINLNLGEIK